METIIFSSADRSGNFWFCFFSYFFCASLLAGGIVAARNRKPRYRAAGSPGARPMGRDDPAPRGGARRNVATLRFHRTGNFARRGRAAAAGPDRSSSRRTADCRRRQGTAAVGSGCGGGGGRRGG